MLSAERAISVTRRTIATGLAARILLWAAAVTVVAAGPFIRQWVDSTLVLIALCVCWITLSVRSTRGQRLTADFPHLVARGDYAEAESRIEQTLSMFSLFRAGKLMALHNLAVLRNAQNRHRDAVTLCRALLDQRLGSVAGLSRSSRLMLAQSLLELNDTTGAGEALKGLRDDTGSPGRRVTLIETLNLLSLELDYQARAGAWTQMFAGYMSKVQLAELMPAGQAARAQALLALAARRCDRQDASQWLARRAELILGADRLVRDRPALGELFDRALTATSFTNDKQDQNTLQNDTRSTSEEAQS